MFKKAERKCAKLRLALYGLTNSGKTYSALRIAKGMNFKKIAMLDSESGRGEIYGSDFDYDVLRIEAPYNPQKYVQAIKAAEAAGYDLLIIDSLSHAWSGEGGILSIVDDSGSNKFSGGWKYATPIQNQLIDAIVSSKMHIIVTMRAKSEYVLETNEKGKQAPRKVGLGFVQRDGVDYEFTVVMRMEEKNIAYIEKDNTKNYDKQFVQPSEEMGEKFIEWLNSGASPVEDFVNVETPKILSDIANALDLNDLKDIYGVVYRKYADAFPKEFDVIRVAKDKRKIEIDKTELDNISSDIPLNPSIQNTLAKVQ